MASALVCAEWNANMAVGLILKEQELADLKAFLLTLKTSGAAKQARITNDPNFDC